MRGLGTIVNVITVVAGTAVGMFVGPRIPDRVRETVLNGVGLVTVVIGIADGLRSHNIVFPLVAIVLGGIIGEALRLEDRLESVGERVRSRIGRFGAGAAAEPGAVGATGGTGGTGATGGGHATFVEGFVSASLLFCVGPLTILGSISDGLGRGAQELIVKAALDGLVAIVFASTLGIGVAFSALTILVVQGTITAGAGMADRVLTARMITEMTATGGVMIVAIGVRLLELRKIRVGSLLPALLVAPVAVALFAR